MSKMHLTLNGYNANRFKMPDYRGKVPLPQVFWMEVWKWHWLLMCVGVAFSHDLMLHYSIGMRRAVRSCLRHELLSAWDQVEGRPNVDHDRRAQPSRLRLALLNTKIFQDQMWNPTFMLGSWSTIFEILYNIRGLEWEYQMHCRWQPIFSSSLEKTLVSTYTFLIHLNGLFNGLFFVLLRFAPLRAAASK
jgi:hypothetical protein